MYNVKMELKQAIWKVTQRMKTIKASLFCEEVVGSEKSRLLRCRRRAVKI